VAANFDKDFKSQYEAARAVLARSEAFDRDWRPLVKKLHQLVGDGGFDAGHEVALGDLRARVTKGASQTKVSEDRGLLEAAGGWTEGDVGSVVLDAKRRAGALKFLRHVYLLNKAGERKVWIHSLPVAFTDWASAHLEDSAATTGAVKLLLRSADEHFSEQQKRYLANSTLQAMAWCQKAGMVLANAGAAAGSGPNPARDNARQMVRRWFAEPGLTDATLDNHISTLKQGFKNIVAALSKGQFIVTDWVPFRASTDADEIGYRNAEAFTFASRAEGLDVVYIESNFFVDNPGNVLPGQANWTRIVLHELTHLVCGTTDVENGDSRYAWYGIGPHAGYPAAECVTNADNWAFFAAD
jgi:hypothetical protein